MLKRLVARVRRFLGIEDPKYVEYQKHRAETECRLYFNGARPVNEGVC